jgi:hypothetical protein
MRLDSPARLTGSLFDDCTPQVADDGFLAFWLAYPRKDGRKPAQEVWSRLQPSREQQAVFLEALERQKRSDQWRRGYIPHAKSWLRQARWEDRLEGPKAVTVPAFNPTDAFAVDEQIQVARRREQLAAAGLSHDAITELFDAEADM